MRKFGLIGQKKGMTQVFDEKGFCVPVTVVQTGPCTVVQVKEKKKEGYNAIQLGFKETKASKLNKPRRGHFEKKQVPPFATLKEFRVGPENPFQVGQVMTVKAFQPGDLVDVQGISKGRGFQGVIKRWRMHGGPDSHGSDFHRRPGSIGQNSWPSRVFKNMRMPGRMGNARTMIRNIKVVQVLPDDNLLLVRGSLPGAKESLVTIYHRSGDFASRFFKKEEKETQP